MDVIVSKDSFPCFTLVPENESGKKMNSTRTGRKQSPSQENSFRAKSSGALGILFFEKKTQENLENYDKKLFLVQNGPFFK